MYARQNIISFFILIVRDKKVIELKGNQIQVL